VWSCCWSAARCSPPVALKAASAFFVIDSVAKAIARQGYVGVAGNNVNYPAIAVLPNGKGVMAFILVGGNHYPSAAYAPLSGGGNVGTVHVAGKGSAPRTASASTSSSTAPASIDV
jgi:hypothetical protein